MQLPKTTPEQRQEIYADVRDLIVPGFLAHPVSVNGARFVLRTLDATDWYLLRYRAHGLVGREFKAWAVAVSIWMVDGVIVLDQEDVLYEIYGMCVRLPTSVLDDLQGVVDGLMRRLRKATECIEGYLYETESRQLWKTEGQVILGRADRGGVARSRNPIVRLWVYYNQLEDEREHEDYLWSLTKFIVGPHAPKGIKKIHAKDRQRETDVAARRQRLLDRTYYEAKGILKKEPRQLKGPRKTNEYRVAETEQELQEEMRRWVAGEKDEHDLVIDGIKRRIREDVEARREQEEQRRRELAEAMQNEGVSPSQIVPLTGEAGQAFVDRIKARMHGTKVVAPGPTHNHAYDKYIKNAPQAGALHVDESGLHSSAPADPRLIELLTKPDREGLQEAVEGRRPTAVVDDSDEGR